ncbi:hypothetical protein A6F68_00960 [Tsuneonella dongtanensis]|uniref:Lipoprotein n=1 Tax=Tsuneonella dongtanensis TaxID=692370 RepID=A0A1B2ABR2_9SPHN|nr:hypothetical protein [Tsuneonella dongtanensis]ANY19485.1 hypothetical protein A6F68_00960 [Tsuneonella dongtanensis]
MSKARFLALPLALALAACGGGGGGAEAERKTAAGEVLGGSISDDMLPLDTVTSQSPPLRETSDAPTAASSRSTDAPTPKEDEPAAEPEQAPEPAAEN